LRYLAIAALPYHVRYLFSMVIEALATHIVAKYVAQIDRIPAAARFSLDVLARQYAVVRAEIVAIEKRIHPKTDLRSAR
jgi:hypothetical protein